MSGDDPPGSETTGPLGELTAGVRAVAGGIRFIATGKGALGTALLPAILAFGFGVGLAALGLWGVVVASAAVVGAGGGFATLGRGLFDVTLGSVVLFVAIGIALAVAQPLSRRALDDLTRRLGLSLGLPREERRPASSVLASLGTALSAVGVTLPTIAILEGVTALAPETAIVSEPLTFLVSALALAWDLFDHPMSRRGWSARTRLRWMKDNAFAVVGFALAAQAMLLVPLLDLFILPVGVLGATRLIATRDAADPARSTPPPAA